MIHKAQLPALSFFLVSPLEKNNPRSRMVKFLATQIQNQGTPAKLYSFPFLFSLLMNILSSFQP